MYFDSVMLRLFQTISGKRWKIRKHYYRVSIILKESYIDRRGTGPRQRPSVREKWFCVHNRAKRTKYIYSKQAQRTMNKKNPAIPTVNNPTLLNGYIYKMIGVVPIVINSTCYNELFSPNIQFPCSPAPLNISPVWRGHDTT